VPPNWQTARVQPNAASLADRAAAVITRFVRLGAGLAAVVGVMGLLVAGTAFLVGRSALDGSAEQVWSVVGLLLLAAAVVPPLLASFRLYSVGRWTNQLVDEFRSLLDAGGEASTVVIETTEFSGAAGSQALVTTVMPTVGRLRTQALRAGTARRLSAILTTLTSLPWLLLLAVVAILVSAGAGFILLLIWIF
jgi:hypothetical protein